MCDGRAEEVEGALRRLVEWAVTRPDVRALALVGSRAYGAPNADSDVDLVLLCTEPARYIEHDDWLEEIGRMRLVRTVSWGAITERRLALPSGLELDVGIGSPAWARNQPLDAGTQRVVSEGMRALYDPEGMLAALLRATGQAASPRVQEG